MKINKERLRELVRELSHVVQEGRNPWAPQIIESRPTPYKGGNALRDSIADMIRRRRQNRVVVIVPPDVLAAIKSHGFDSFR